MAVRPEAERRSARISDRIYLILREQIIVGARKPGELVEEAELVDKLQASRTPVREVLNRLVGEGLVRRLPNGAWIVRELGIADCMEILAMRRLLEGEAAALAATKMDADVIAALRTEIAAMNGANRITPEEHWAGDDRFHEAIAAAAGNRMLQASILDLRARARVCSAGRVPGRARDTCREHIAILDAIASGNAASAREKMCAHVNAIIQNLAWLD